MNRLSTWVQTFWQKWRERSIVRRLLSLSFVMLVFAGIVTSVQLSYNVRKEMLELIDGNLVQYANSLYMLEQQVQGYGYVSDPIKINEDDEEREHEERGKHAKPDASEHKKLPAKPKTISTIYSETGMAFQVWDQDAQRLIIRSRNAPETPMAQFSTGFLDQDVAGKSWRTYVYMDRVNHRAIVVAQEQTLSTHIINEIVTRLTVPILLGFLVLLGLFFWIIRQSLRPLFALNQAIAQRSPLNLQPIHMDKTPAEITPMIGSLNTLMSSLEDSLNKERHFTGNAAHELRTPLAVIDTLTQTAIKTQDMGILPKIKAATNHARRQIEQLLTLARLDANMGLTKTHDVNLYAVSQNVCADLLNIRAKKIDIQMHGDERTHIHSTEDITYILLKNIIDNAFKHTPDDGGQIRVDVFANPSPSIRITDNGTGISPEQLARITERFFRAEQAHDGFGIGLSIVQRICTLHQAQLSITNRTDGQTGLCVQVTYPAYH